MWVTERAFIRRWPVKAACAPWLELEMIKFVSKGFRYHSHLSSILQGLPIEQKGHIDEHSGLWEMVAIPVLDPAQTFSTYASYTLKNLHPGAVYDVIAKAKNEFGWSEWSKTFNCFNKGVGKKTTWEKPVLQRNTYQVCG